LPDGGQNDPPHHNLLREKARISSSFQAEEHTPVRLFSGPRSDSARVKRHPLRVSFGTRTESDNAELVAVRLTDLCGASIAKSGARIELLRH
jgi:hypothetical protein